MLLPLWKVFITLIFRALYFDIKFVMDVTWNHSVTSLEKYSSPPYTLNTFVAIDVLENEADST
jgi:hypothetical protein